MDFDALLGGHASTKTTSVSTKKRKRGACEVPTTSNIPPSSRDSEVLLPSCLIVVPAGKASLHRTWFDSLSLEERNRIGLRVVFFDKPVDEEDDEFPNKPFDYVERRRKGTKWELVRMALQAEFPSWSGAPSTKKEKAYDYVWLPDDDVTFDERDEQSLGSFLRTTKRFNLFLTQPSLHPDSFFPNELYRTVLEHKPGAILHYTNFVEIMAPLIKTNVLKNLLFKEFILDPKVRSGWGLDTCWPVRIEKAFGAKKIAVVDSSVLRHTRELNSFAAQSKGRGFYAEYRLDPRREEYELLKRARVKSKGKKVLEIVVDPKDDDASDGEPNKIK